MGATSFGRRVVSIPLVWTLLNVLSGVTADCAAGSTTLTTEGCSGCGDYDLCLGFSSADECSGSDCVADGDCTYQCMSVNANLSTLVVLIEFGGFKSSKEVAAGGYTDTGYPDLTNKWPSANNDDVTAVSTIDVSSAVTTFIMSGGTAAVNYPQGKVASVTLTADFISAATAVTKVVLQNLDLDAEIASLSSLLPSTVEHIELYNTLLSDFPAGLGDLTSLQQLILDYNYITSVDSLDVIDSLTTLSLESNSIASFTGVFANLEYLYLGDNNLTSIPSAIFSHSHLSVLNLTGNSFESRSLTLDQADFLNSLETLVLSDSDFAVDLECDDMEQVEVQDVTAKLSDFGTSRFRSVENTMTAGVGTGRWLAPEVIRCDTDYGCSADIYSFGALLTELDTNQIPYSNTRGSNDKILSDMTILHRVATGKLHPEVRSTYFTDTWPSASNDDVTAVGTIKLSSAVKTFIMSGGTAAMNYPQGKVSSVTLTSDFISSATAVTRVVLQNLALAGKSHIASAVALGLQLHHDCRHLGRDRLPYYATLSLESNSITTFTSVFTNLEYLFLGDNNLTSVPTAIYKHSYLKKLNLTGNSFSVREFTREQADFLKDFETLYLSASDFTVDLECDDSEQVAVHDVTICLGSGVTASSSDTSADATSATTSDTTSGTNTASSSTGTDGPDTKTTSSSDSSSSTTTIVGIVCGTVAALLAIFLFILYRRKSKNAAQQKLGDSFEFSGTRFPSIDSDLVLQQQPYGNLRTSAVFGMDIPMTSTEFSMANQTAGGEDDDSMGIPTSVDGSMGIPTSVDGSMGVPTSTQGSSAYPSSMPTVEAAERNPDRFMSIWNDPDLLSVQVRAADVKDLKQLGNELDTNKIPYSNARGSNGKILSDMTILHRVATGKLHPQVGSDCSPVLKELVERCLIEDQSKRPTAAVIAYELRLIKKDMAAVLAQPSDLTLSELN
uniref:Protein kinase domain-containing protein n=1 Tax=Phytophthora fragariae TaxID=53985 RepID=A0A6A3F213_9STRA|nr:hypothetical protein PF009_g11458 [Phytophthora fragariae]